MERRGRGLHVILFHKFPDDELHPPHVLCVLAARVSENGSESDSFFSSSLHVWNFISFAQHKLHDDGGDVESVSAILFPFTVEGFFGEHFCWIASEFLDVLAEVVIVEVEVGFDVFYDLVFGAADEEMSQVDSWRTHLDELEVQ